MAVQVPMASLAYTYAWWLTGDDAQAEQAVLAALEIDRVREAMVSGALEPLLAEVRAAAISEPTMCPASELALLHDRQGVELPVAASLVALDPDEARTGLAHGRLEALQFSLEDVVAHPERLGGLATANPADIAHARQCDSCERIRELLVQGRTEIRELPALDLPDAVRAVLAGMNGATPQAGEADRAGGADEEGQPSRADELAPARIEPPAGHEQAEPAAAPPAAPGRAWWRPSLLALAIVAIVVLLTVWLSRDEPTDFAGAPTDPGSTATADPRPQASPTTGQAPGVVAPAASPAPTPAGNPTAAPTVTASPPASPPVATEPAPGPTPEGFSVIDAGLLVDEAGEPQPSGTSLSDDEPVRIAVTYRGAGGGVQLEARWAVDGEPFRTLDVTLNRPEGTHIFGEAVPAGGWPSGAHEIVLLADEAVLGIVTFTVA